MREIDYSELDGQHAIVLGVALGDRLLEAVTGETATAGGLLERLVLDSCKGWLVEAGYEEIETVSAQGAGRL